MNQCTANQLDTEVQSNFERYRELLEEQQTDLIAMGIFAPPEYLPSLKAHIKHEGALKEVDDMMVHTDGKGTGLMCCLVFMPDEPTFTPLARVVPCEAEHLLAGVVTLNVVLLGLGFQGMAVHTLGTHIQGLMIQVGRKAGQLIAEYVDGTVKFIEGEEHLRPIEDKGLH